MLNAKLMEANATKEQYERKPDAAAADKGNAAAADAKERVAPSADPSPAASAAPASGMAAQASMGGGQRSWWSFFGL